jgi:L-fucose mutarotase/ribose pyranase (RbsD/FucU family)
VIELAGAPAPEALVRTGELRPYGTILLVKGVVNRYEPAR